MVDYSSTKGAMNSFIRSLALQQVGNGIRVCGKLVLPCYRAPSRSQTSPTDSIVLLGVAPGPVYTPRKSRLSNYSFDNFVRYLPVRFKNSSTCFA
jgi:NAD(P)-dependent dehydrogenase (short-subunit alcohol dehydrogenase family)